ncbi:testis-expressed protein 51 isoform X1 [Pantherophis guttatus]|uniref:Testis-expressed protein 51 isoform X1 n=1 Tax=Pantherophis guttatus TaxID=94885 RepID=A0A6P9C6G0_PANGU|nr:testis-expressed protein 51 isoform X1 [Pantherophis guttatus]
MATASLLGLLLWAAPVKLAGTCLRCWPDAAAYFIYDANLLLQKDSAASDQLGTLFLGNVKELASYGSGYLEREHMEREAGNLFHHLELIIQKSQTNHEVLMKEAEMEKADFIKRLEEASNLFVKEICSFSCGQSRFRPYEVAQCRNCQILKASCYDLRICAGPNIVAAVLISLTVLLGVLGVAMWYCCRKKTSEETESQDEDDDDKDNEDDSSGTSEGSEKSEEAALTTSVPYYSNPPETDMPSPPEFDVPSPPEFDMPSPPEYDMPNPPEYDIPSPPNF